jgi:hypothetical protein
MPEQREPLQRLLDDGFVKAEPTRLRTTPRWQATMARAALALQHRGAPWQDLRLPIAAALAEHYDRLSDEELAQLVEAMLPVEEAELGAVVGPPGAP